MAMSVSEMSGRWVRLEPLDEAHREGLRTPANDVRIWAHTLTSGHGAGFDPWFDEALSEHKAGRRIPFGVRRLSDGVLIGSTSYLDISPRHKRIEIGATWYHPSVWGSAINPECKLLLLSHAFEALGVNRVSLLTDARNERSQAAIARLGATREGILRSHMITGDGRVRDTVVFAIISCEWRHVRADLLSRVAAGPPCSATVERRHHR
jgi:RimJ/RimL family protein N-acetyltransferase